MTSSGVADLLRILYGARWMQCDGYEATMEDGTSIDDDRAATAACDSNENLLTN